MQPQMNMHQQQHPHQQQHQHHQQHQPQQQQPQQQQPQQQHMAYGKRPREEPAAAGWDPRTGRADPRLDPRADPRARGGGAPAAAAQAYGRPPAAALTLPMRQPQQPHQPQQPQQSQQSQQPPATNQQAHLEHSARFAQAVEAQMGALLSQMYIDMGITDPAQAIPLNQVATLNPSLFAQMKAAAEASVGAEFAAAANALPVDLSDENRSRMLATAMGLGPLPGAVKAEGGGEVQGSCPLVKVRVVGGPAEMGSRACERPFTAPTRRLPGYAQALVAEHPVVLDLGRAAQLLVRLQVRPDRAPYLATCRSLSDAGPPAGAR